MAVGRAGGWPDWSGFGSTARGPAHIRRHGTEGGRRDYPQYGACACNGSTVGWERADPPEGQFTRTHILNYFQQNNYRLPVHPATLCIRRQLVLALGGWTALPGGEDTGLLLGASVIADGYFIGEPGLLYRRHPDQITGQADWTKPSEWMPRMRLIEARALALQDLWEQR
ncbi:hypothetical protein GA0070624_1314 [Micromonospora rhizosphaerae]|uniref:Uncharacterized protein n=1 Tax=Micromonospora rhizosphaerae TaxID=568872 RepID=A0A1C6RK48_9ACTN|nr:hypothetical protein [Micromonospora rhizosphaerae]SCL17520.1 hypothetical protein GA0070624_1314 [Micromonospora rhizosphaerae]